MEIALFILGLALIISGIIGSFLPVLPGPPLAWLGLLMLYFVPEIPYDYWLLGISLFFAAGIMILDFLIPIYGTKKYGGTKYGMYGATFGLIVGLFFPPFGILIGPFVGAFLLEIIFNQSSAKNAFRSAWGSFVGFLVSTFMKFITCLVFLIIYIYKVWQYGDVIF